MIRTLPLALLATFLFSSTAEAQRGQRRGPPPGAIKACKGKSAGDSCTFRCRRGTTVKGTCGVRRATGNLVCRPDSWRGPRGPRRGRGRLEEGPGAEVTRESWATTSLSRSWTGSKQKTTGSYRLPW